MAVHDHEMVSIYGMGEEQIDALLRQASECVLMWATRDGWPVGVVHAFVWHEGKVWLTFAAHRHRAEAIRRDPRVSVTVSSAAAPGSGGPHGAVTLKGRARFHEDRATKEWFYRALAHKVSPDSAEGADAFRDVLDSPLRLVLEVEPVKWITFDASKSTRDLRGKLSEDEKTPRLSSDAVRMNRERARRGLPAR